MVTKAELRVRSLGSWLLAVGIIAAVVGVAYDVNAMTQPQIRVPVAIEKPDPFGGWGNVELVAPGVTLADSQWLSGARPQGAGCCTSTDADSTLTLTAWDATRVEQAFARGDALVGGLALLGLSILLLPVFDAIGRGAPFARGSGRRLVGSGLLVASAGWLAPQLPAYGGALVLARTGLDDGPLMPASAFTSWPLLAGALLVALGVAFRRGEAIARQAEGLV